MLPDDNVSMSVGHLDHVLIVYSFMEHVTWKSPGPVEENHDKAKVVDREAQRQTRWIKRGTLDQENTDVHESGCTILPTQPHKGPGDFQVTCSIEL